MKKKKLYMILIIAAVIIVAASFAAYKAGLLDVLIEKAEIIKKSPFVNSDPNNRPDESSRKTEKAQVSSSDPNDSEKVKDANDVVADANDPNDSLEALNLKDVQAKDIIKKLADWTGKVIIASDEVMKQKITIYSPKKLTREKALGCPTSPLFLYKRNVNRSSF